MKSLSLKSSLHKSLQRTSHTCSNSFGQISCLQSFITINNLYISNPNFWIKQHSKSWESKATKNKGATSWTDFFKSKASFTRPFKNDHVSRKSVKNDKLPSVKDCDWLYCWISKKGSREEGSGRTEGGVEVRIRRIERRELALKWKYQ